MARYGIQTKSLIIGMIAGVVVIPFVMKKLG